MSDKLKLAEMLCTRFCHDIIGPVGAVNNGAELLREESRNSTSQAVDLIESSAKEAVARVQFYRQAYGVLQNTGAGSFSDMREVALGYFAAGKIRLDWDEKYTDSSDIYPSNTHKKLIFNLLVVASAVLIRGGKIKFELSEGRAMITAEGEKASLAPNFEACLKGELSENDIDPRLVQCFYTQQVAKDSGETIGIHKLDNGVVFSIKLP